MLKTVRRITSTFSVWPQAMCQRLNRLAQRCPWSLPLGLIQPPKGGASAARSAANLLKEHITTWGGA